MRRLLLLALAVLALTMAPGARAATPLGLTQPAGAAACLADAFDSCATARGGVNQQGVAVSPDGKDVYVAGDGLQVFARAADGTLTQLTGVAGCFNADGSGGCTTARGLEDTPFDDLAVTPDGKSVIWAAGSSLLVFKRETSTGKLTQLSGLDGCWTPDGTDGTTPGTCSTGPGDGSFGAQWVAAYGRSVYVGSSAVNTPVAEFSRDPTSGKLTSLGCLAEAGSGTACSGIGHAIDNSTDLAVSPNGAFAYISSSYDGAVDIFGRDTTTGVLTEVSSNRCVGFDASTGCAPQRALEGDLRSEVMSPDGKHLYVLGSDPTGYGGGVAVFKRDTTTGALSEPAGPKGCLTGTGADKTGVAGTCAQGRALDGLERGTVSADGLALYVAAPDANAVDILARNASSGALTQLSGGAGCKVEHGTGGPASCQTVRGLETAWDVAVSPDETSAYAAANAAGGLAVFDRTIAPPTVANKAPTGLKPTQAQFNGTVNPNGGHATYQFAFAQGTSGGTFTTVPATPLDAGTGTTPRTVSYLFSELSPDTTYRVHIIATNASGTRTASGNAVFTTPSAR